TITGGVVTSGTGGGIFNAGALTITNSTISGNTGVGLGAGIYNSFSFLTISNSTISGNELTAGASSSDGAGIYNSFGNATLVNSTVSGNRTPNNGGGIYNASGSTLTSINSTIADNIAGDGPGNLGSGGGIYCGGTEKLFNTILVNNLK